MTDDPLAALIAWAAACGVAGLLGVTLLERLVPILPSYGLLVAIGIAAAGGAWSVPTALVASTVAVGVLLGLVPQLSCWKSAGVVGGSQPVWVVWACSTL